MKPWIPMALPVTALTTYMPATAQNDGASLAHDNGSCDRGTDAAREVPLNQPIADTAT